MKKVRYSLMEKIYNFIFTIIFVFVIVNMYRNLNPADYTLNILFVCVSVKLIAATSLITVYNIHWQIDFDDEQFIFRTIFRKPLTIKYNDIEKINIRYINTKNGICDELMFQLKNTDIQPCISLPENTENYNEFFNLLMIKTE